MKRTLYALPAAIAIAAAATAAALPGTAAPSQPALTQPSPGQSYWPHQEDLMEAATRVEDAARQRWPDLYAGVALDVPGNVLLVHRIPAGPDVDAAVRALVPGTKVRLVNAAHTEEQLRQWAERINTDTPTWEHRGVTITGVGPKLGRCVMVGVETDLDLARPLLVAHYPDVTLCVEQQGHAVPLDMPKP